MVLLFVITQLPRSPSPLPLLTFAFLLTHDRVTEGEQAEELMSVCVSHFY